MKQFSQTAILSEPDKEKKVILVDFVTVAYSSAPSGIQVAQSTRSSGVCNKCCQLNIMMTPHNIWGVHSSMNGATPEGYQRSLGPDPHP